METYRWGNFSDDELFALRSALLAAAVHREPSPLEADLRAEIESELSGLIGPDGRRVEK